MNNSSNYFLLLTMTIVMFSCNQEGMMVDESNITTDDIIVGLASPITADLDVTVIDLNDYLLANAIVDSVTLGDELLEFNGAEIHIHDWNSDHAMEPMSLWSQGYEYVIPVFRSPYERYTFSFDAGGRDFSSVQLKGEMCAWNPDVLEFEKEDGVYRTEMVLKPGSYQYIMLLDGEEILDFNNSKTVDNGIGGFNSVLEYGALTEADLHLSAGEELHRIDLDVNDASEVLVLWEDQKLNVKIDRDQKYVMVPELAKQKDRSHIRAWAYDEQRVSNDLLIPLDNGAVIRNASALERMDKHAMSLYNAFVDRFHNGDTSNDRPLAMEEVHPRADDHGGDLRGVIQKLESGYFDSLSINTIWVSPIVKNVEGAWGKWPEPETKFSAYHGYWPISFTLIDDRKGTPAEFHELVEKAHARNMNVLLDFVANHVHEDHPYYQEHPEYATDLYLPDGRMNTELWDEQRLTTWFDVFLPTLKLDEPAVYEMLTDSAVYWITEYNLDGFRHDATKHVPEIFWKTLTRKLKDEVIAKGRDLYQIGETYGTSELISSYVNSGQLDAQFDFNVYDALVASLCREEIGFERLDDQIHNSLETYGHHHLMGNITGNQDRGRFMSYAGGALRFDENAKAAGWSREIGVGDDIAYQKSKTMMMVNATIPGLPVIYNGDEIGSYGGNDPDNRKLMRFGEDLSEKEQDLLTEYRELMLIRRESMPLIYGDFRSHLVEEDSYVYSRNYLGKSVVVLINNSSGDKTMTVRLDEDQALAWKNGREGARIKRNEDGTISLSVPSNSYEILF